MSIRKSKPYTGSRPGYISGSAVSILLLISVSAIIYATWKARDWFDTQKMNHTSDEHTFERKNYSSTQYDRS